MCTIMTIDSLFYSNNRTLVRDRIKSDARMNGDGWSLLCIDPDQPELNVQVNSLRLKIVLATIDTFFDEAGDEARMFLHARYATTSSVGIGYCHGFSDFNGRIIMHNGVIANPHNYAIDSYRLIGLPQKDDEILGFFEANKDQYANVFVIDTDMLSYTVVRLTVGSLYHDGHGNYSTNSIGGLNKPVNAHTVVTHNLDTYAPIGNSYGLKDDDEFFLDSWDTYWKKGI